MLKTDTSLNANWLMGLQTSTNYTFPNACQTTLSFKSCQYLVFIFFKISSFLMLNSLIHKSIYLWTFINPVNFHFYTSIFIHCFPSIYIGVDYFLPAVQVEHSCVSTFLGVFIIHLLISAWGKWTPLRTGYELMSQTQLGTSAPFSLPIPTLLKY